MDQQNITAKIDLYDDLYEKIREAARNGDYATAKAAQELIHQLQKAQRPGSVTIHLPPGVHLDPVVLPKAHVVFDPTGQMHEPLPKQDDFYDSYEGQWVKEFNRACEHEPVDVGFANVVKVVCKKCNRELPKEALYGPKTFQ